ncbi:MAG: DUF885 domain-containing protein, partial [Parahaliea sp.]
MTGISASWRGRLRRYWLGPWLFAAIALVCPALLAGQDSEALARLLSEHWQRSQAEQVWFRRDPDAFRLDGALPGFADEARQRRHQYNEAVLTQLEGIAPAQLTAPERISLRVFRYEREAERAAFSQPDYLFPLTNRSSWQSYFLNAPENMSFLSAGDYRRYLDSLADYPRYNTEQLAILERALARGYTHHCQSMTGFEGSLRAAVVDDPRDSALYAPFARMPSTISAAEQHRLQAEGRRLIGEQVLPAFRAFADFYQQQYAPRCRQAPGIDALDGGAGYYAWAVGFYTTTAMTPRQVHDLGLEEVARIRAEMDAV